MEEKHGEEFSKAYLQNSEIMFISNFLPDCRQIAEPGLLKSASKCLLLNATLVFLVIRDIKEVNKNLVAHFTCKTE